MMDWFWYLVTILGGLMISYSDWFIAGFLIWIGYLLRLNQKAPKPAKPPGIRERRRAKRLAQQAALTPEEHLVDAVMVAGVSAAYVGHKNAMYGAIAGSMVGELALRLAEDQGDGPLDNGGSRFGEWLQLLSDGLFLVFAAMMILTVKTIYHGDPFVTNMWGWDWPPIAFGFLAGLVFIIAGFVRVVSQMLQESVAAQALAMVVFIAPITLVLIGISVLVALIHFGVIT